jgi:hypothetical protein
MFDTLSSWNLKLIYEIDLVKEITSFDINKKYLLNTEKLKFNVIEKIVYELSEFHIKQLNLNEKNVFIEFFIEDLVKSKMDINYDKKITEQFISPSISTITYLNNNNIPDILTDIDIETYKFKNVENKNSLGFSFPRFLKHVSFEGGKFFHGIENIFNENTQRITLKVNIWDKRPMDIPLYENELTSQNNIYSLEKIILDNFEKSSKTNKILTTENVINENLFENILYKNHINFENETLESLSKFYNEYDIIILEKEETKIDNINKIITMRKHIDISSKKFLQRFMFKNIYNKFMCNFIMNESLHFLKNNENLIDYNNYKILDIDKVPDIINIIINSFQYIIIENIQKSYCLKDNESYHIDKIFIIKNDTSKVSEFFCEKSSISINIMLNTQFEGGNLNFDDGLVTKLDIGDMIIYSSNTNHTYLPVSSGLQYVLVGLINIYEKLT